MYLKTANAFTTQVKANRNVRWVDSSPSRAAFLFSLWIARNPLICLKKRQFSTCCALLCSTIALSFDSTIYPYRPVRAWRPGSIFGRSTPSGSTGRRHTRSKMNLVESASVTIAPGTSRRRGVADCGWGFSGSVVPKRNHRHSTKLLQAPLWHKSSRSLLVLIRYSRMKLTTFLDRRIWDHSCAKRWLTAIPQQISNLLVRFRQPFSTA